MISSRVWLDYLCFVGISFLVTRHALARSPSARTWAFCQGLLRRPAKFDHASIGKSPADLIARVLCPLDRSFAFTPRQQWREVAGAITSVD